MDAALAFLEAHGYWLLFGLGFAEFAGFPVTSAPVLLAAGALSAAGNLNLLAAALSAAAGGLTADSLWYLLARWKGSRLVDLACSLTSNPTACVLGVSRKVARFGGPYVLAAKFIPGAGNLIASAAGLAGLPAARFLGFDAAAVLLWALAYISAGRIFSNEIGAVATWLGSYLHLALAVVILLIASATGWRVARFRMHRQQHGRET
jgi:membrane protein DedA with SNARE-associated domain